jgi:hypothetical protein
LSLVSPRAIDRTIEQFGFIVGEEGIISVQVQANPKPYFIWTVDQESFSEGRMDSTQRFEAISARGMVRITSIFLLNLLHICFIVHLKDSL